MAQFISQKKSARNLVLSPNSQLAYGGALADLNLTRRQRFDGSSSILELTQTRRSDKEYSGKGTQFATDGQLTGWDTKFALKAELDAWLAGYAFAFAMGAEVVTGQAAPYTHAISFSEVSGIAPCTTVYLEDTNDVKYKVPDMTVSDLTLTIPARGACSMELGFVGTGRFTQGAMVAALPALAAYNYLLGSDCAFSIGPSGAPVAAPARHMQTTIKITTNNASHVAPGGGLFGHFVRMGIAQISIQTTIAAKDADDIFTLFANDTLSAMSWNINSGAQAQLQINVPNTKVKATKLGVDGSMVVWQLEADDTTMFTAGAVSLMSVQIINGVAAYLVGA